MIGKTRFHSILKNICKQKYLIPNYKHERYCSATVNSASDLKEKTLPQTIDPCTVSYGQPTKFTHPHLINDNELVPGVTQSEFRERRDTLMSNIYKFGLSLNSSFKSHLVIIPSGIKKYMSDKIPYVFRQNSDFYYYTGCLEPDSILVICIDDKKHTKSIIFVRPKDSTAELWDGSRTGVDMAPTLFGVDESYPVDEFNNYLIKLAKPHVVWYDEKISDQKKISDMVDACKTSGIWDRCECPTSFIHRQRLIKSHSEIYLMRKTCRIAAESINQTIRETKPGDSEHHVFARVDYHCRMRNANYLAYPPVVAAGTNATTIHYINNTQLIKPTDMILMDAGCEYGGYSSDITRTWPVSGRFTQPQDILYDVVAQLQNDLIGSVLKEGGQTLDDLFQTMCIKLGGYLQEVGLISKQLTGLDVARAAYKFCPHHVSHFLGMDVHDTPLIARTIPLLPGMVCTVEPGIYIGSNRRDVPEEFRGLGVRIEDDILVTTDGIEVLTESCVKDKQKLLELIQGN